MAKFLQAYLPHSKQQYFIYSAVALVLSYAIGSRALDTGSLGQYALTFILFYFCVRFIVQALRVKTDGKRR